MTSIYTTSKNVGQNLAHNAETKPNQTQQGGKNRDRETGKGKHGEKGRGKRENGKGRKGKLGGEGRGWKGTALNYALKLQP